MLRYGIFLKSIAAFGFIDLIFSKFGIRPRSPDGGTIDLSRITCFFRIADTGIGLDTVDYTVSGGIL